MTRTLMIAPLMAAAALCGCDNGSNTVVLNPDGTEVNEAQEEAVKNVELPPAIASSKIYRCKDNSVVYIDWLADNKSANFRAAKGESPVQLKGEEAEKPMVAGGYSLTGSPEASSVSLTRPGKGEQSCKA